MLMYGKEASNRKQEIDRQHHTIPNQRANDKHHGNVYNLLFRYGKVRSQNMEKLKSSFPTFCKRTFPQLHKIASYAHYAQCRLLRKPSHRKERDDYKIDLACGPQEIELFIIKNAPARVNYPEALGLRHLAFKVENVDDTVKELNGKGIETEPVRLDDYTGKKMTFFHDPDGLPLEIHE